MWNKVKLYIDSHHLLDKNETYLVALSGGADSVALLTLLNEQGYHIHAVHCHFHLRGAESDRDEQFCVSLCQRLGIELHRVHFDTKTYADLHHISIEMAARELRYAYFEQLRKDIGAAGICVAHHRDDSVETVLLNLIRGTGLRGLTGIQPRHGNILRPLLGVSRNEIEQYLKKSGQDYVVDSTNLECDALRNIIRLQVIPLLKTLNPAVADNIFRTSENLVEAQKVLDSIISSLKNGKEFKPNELEKFGSCEYLLYECLNDYGFNGAQIHQMLHAKTGSVFTSPSGYEVCVDRERLLLSPVKKPMKTFVIPEEGNYVLEDGRKIKVHLCDSYISKAPLLVTLDADKVHFPLTIRTVEKGDWLIPFGMKGKQLVSDLMTNLKLNVIEKREQLVVVDAQGMLIWVVGLRVDDRAAVSKTTMQVLELSILKP